MNIFDLIREGRQDEFLELLDKTFKKAAREASDRAHALGIEVADGRPGEPLPLPFNIRKEDVPGG